LEWLEFVNFAVEFEAHRAVNRDEFKKQLFAFVWFVSGFRETHQSHRTGNRCGDAAGANSHTAIIASLTRIGWIVGRLQKQSAALQINRASAGNAEHSA